MILQPHLVAEVGDQIRGFVSGADFGSVADVGMGIDVGVDADVVGTGIEATDTALGMVVVAASNEDLRNQAGELVGVKEGALVLSRK